MMNVNETTTVVRIPNEILADIQQYIAHYRAVGKFAVDTKKSMRELRKKTGILSIKTSVTLDFEL